MLGPCSGTQLLTLIECSSDDQMGLAKPIEKAIRRSTGATSIDDYDHVQPLWGGYGEVLRVEVTGAPVDTLIVKRVAPPGGTRGKKKSKEAHARTLATYDNELLFYENFADRLESKVRLPRLFCGQRLEDSWIFVMEDLLQAGFVAGRRSYSPADVHGALRFLARFHAEFLGDSGQGLWRHGSYWNLAARKADLPQMKNERLKRLASPLDSRINSAKYKTIIHGDAKTDNFCFPAAVAAEVEVAGFDFQHTGLGCGMKDVMCLLDSSMTPHEALHAAPGYLDFYFDQLHQALRGQDSDIDAADVEAEWRQLYPVAWADYYRFLDGWAPGRYQPEAYVELMLNEAISILAQES